MREGDIALALLPQLDGERKNRTTLVLPRTRVVGSIGSVSPERHRRILNVLSSYLLGNLSIS